MARRCDASPPEPERHTRRSRERFPAAAAMPAKRPDARFSCVWLSSTMGLHRHFGRTPAATPGSAAALNDSADGDQPGQAEGVGPNHQDPHPPARTSASQRSYHSRKLTPIGM